MHSGWLLTQILESDLLLQGFNGYAATHTVHAVLSDHRLRDLRTNQIHAGCNFLMRASETDRIVAIASSSEL